MAGAETAIGSGVARPRSPEASSQRDRGLHRARRNAELWDVEGKRYVDFAGGIAVLNTGHRHPKVMAAVKAQMERFTHTCFQVTLYDSYVEVCERLNAIVPISGPVKSILFSTGAEATENAIKIARAATGRVGRDRLHRRLPRPHHHGHEHDRQGLALQEGVRPGAGGDVPRSLPRAAVRRERGGCAEAPRVPVPGRHRPGAGRGDHHRACAGRGRLSRRRPLR